MPLVRPSPSSSSPLRLSASDRSLSAVEAGEFRAEAFLTREREDLLGGFLRDSAVGVPRRLPAFEPALTELDRGPALPALTTPPAPDVDAFFGVPGPSEECLARPLDVVGTFPGPTFARGPRLVAGPAELSRCLLSIMLAAGVVGAEAACCGPLDWD